MELPKNITQIGEVGRDCKIYVEDYVVSYMKQLNRAARDKDMAVALFGRHREENGIDYYFVYGASKLDFLQREVRHLSQAQRQEIERFRRKYFAELAFVGYRLLDGEMIEGFHICEQDICRYISGYAQFYEKNDAMLAYMLDVREEAQPERVDQEKYEEVKKRQEERRMAAEKGGRGAQVSEMSARDAIGARSISDARNAAQTRSQPPSINLQKMRLTAVGVFALLCLLGIATFRDAEKNKGLQPVQSSNTDMVDAVAASGSVQKDTLVMEDKLEQALLQENSPAGVKTEKPSEESSQEQSLPEESPESSQDPGAEALGTETSLTQISGTQTSGSESGQAKTDTAEQGDGMETSQTSQKKETSQEVSSGAVAYVIQPGDTLIAISRRQYGTDIRVADICNLNKISNPDDIKEGQVIMLPR